jgi:hypothetical protein
VKWFLAGVSILVGQFIFFLLLRNVLG